jgi:hypothetical protein
LSGEWGEWRVRVVEKINRILDAMETTYRKTTPKIVAEVMKLNASLKAQFQRSLILMDAKGQWWVPLRFHIHISILIVLLDIFR